ARSHAKEITDGLNSLVGPAEGFETCLVSTGVTVLDDWRGRHLAARLDRRQTAHRARLSPQVHDRSGKRESAAERRGVAGQRRTGGRKNPPPLHSPRSFPRHFERP